MTAIQFLATIKNDERLRQSVLNTISQNLFEYISSPVCFEPADVQIAFHRDVKEAIFRSRSPLDSLLYLRSKGWPHGCDMHQIMESAHRHIQDATEQIFADRCAAMGYNGPCPVPCVVSISGSEHVVIQVDELIPECCLLAVPATDGQLLRDKDGIIHPTKQSWLRIDAVLRPFDDKSSIEVVKQDFIKYWRKTDFGAGPYYREIPDLHDA